MPNDFFNASGYPAPRAPGVSLSARNEFSAVALGFDKFPALTGNGLWLLRVNAGGTAIEALDPATYVTAAQVAASYLALAGGTMTGPVLGAVGAVGAPGYAFAGDTNNGWWSPGADIQAWSTAGAERMRIGAVGNITIAAPGSGVALAVNGIVSIPDGTSSLFRVIQNGVINSLGSDASGGVLASDTGRWLINTNGSTRLTIAATGNVTIAAPSSGPALTVVNTVADAPGITVDLTDEAFGIVLRGLNRSASGAPQFSVMHNLSDVWLGNDRTGSLIFHTNSVARITANNAGNVSIAAPTSGVALSVSGAALTPTSSQAFTATPTFNAALSNIFEFSGAMTANVTSCTITNPTAGQTITIRVKQDATGSRTFAAPTGAKISGSVQATPSTASLLTLTYSAMDARWEGSWLGLPV